MSRLPSPDERFSTTGYIALAFALHFMAKRGNPKDSNPQAKETTLYTALAQRAQKSNEKNA
jgi:hypothetical protein